MRAIQTKNIIYAADLENAAQIAEVLQEIHQYIVAVKITPHIVINGELNKILEIAENLKISVFLDMKFHDIPQTVYNAVKAAIAKNISMLTVHTSGGHGMLRAAIEARESSSKSSSDVKILGVTKLTSISSAMHDVIMLARQAKNAGLDGVICSAFESKAVKEVCGEDFITATPGIRLKDEKTHDQMRVATPRLAMDNLADYIVLGRPITEANDRKKLLTEILAM